MVLAILELTIQRQLTVQALTPLQGALINV